MVRATSQASNRVCETHGAVSIIAAVAFTRLETTCSRLQNDSSPHLTYFSNRVCSAHIHIHIRGHNLIRILPCNFSQLLIFSKLFNIRTVSRQQNPKLQK
jgi:hypothetical protein